MKPTQKCKLDKYAYSDAPTVQLSYDIIAYASNKQILLLQNASGILLSIIDIGDMVCCMCKTQYAGRISLVICCRLMIVCYSFNSQQLNDNNLQRQGNLSQQTAIQQTLEFQIPLQPIKSLLPQCISFCEIPTFTYIGVVLFDNNNGFVIDIAKKQFIFKLQGIPFQASVIQDITNMVSHSCQCMVNFDKYTDILDGLQKQYHTREQIINKITQFQAQCPSIICNSCQQSILDNYLYDNYSDEMDRVINNEQKYTKDFQDINVHFPFYSHPHVFGDQAVSQFSYQYINCAKKQITEEESVFADYNQIQFINEDIHNKCINFIIYGSYSCILIYSIPILLLNKLSQMKCQQDTQNIILNLYVNKRLFGHFTTRCTNEDLMYSQLLQNKNFITSDPLRSYFQQQKQFLPIQNDVYYTNLLHFDQKNELTFVLISQISGFCIFKTNLIQHPQTCLSEQLCQQLQISSNELVIQEQNVNIYKELKIYNKQDLKTIKNFKQLEDLLDHQQNKNNLKFQIYSYFKILEFEPIVDQIKKESSVTAVKQARYLESNCTFPLFKCKSLLLNNQQNELKFLYQNGRGQILLLDLAYLLQAIETQQQDISKKKLIQGICINDEQVQDEQQKIFDFIGYNNSQVIAIVEDELLQWDLHNE